MSVLDWQMLQITKRKHCNWRYSNKEIEKGYVEETVNEETGVILGYTTNEDVFDDNAVPEKNWGPLFITDIAFD